MTWERKLLVRLCWHFILSTELFICTFEFILSMFDVMIVFSVYGDALIEIGGVSELFVCLFVFSVEFFCDCLDSCVDKMLLWGRA